MGPKSQTYRECFLISGLAVLPKNKRCKAKLWRLESCSPKLRDEPLQLTLLKETTGGEFRVYRASIRLLQGR